MNAVELMIGDWVKSRYGIGKVQSIRYVNTIKDEWEWLINIVINNETFQNYLSLTEIEPIPITPEILKNNFEKKTFYGIYDDYFDLDIREYSDGLYIVTYHSCEFNIPDQTIHLSWAHELQHFMRHCGIEKEIKLP